MQSASERLAFVRRRAGAYLNRARRSVWLQARDPETFEAARPLIAWLRATVPTDRLLFTSPRPFTCAWLRQRYPNDNVLPPPWDAAPFVRRFFRQLQPLLIVLLDAHGRLGRRVLSAARRRSVPVVALRAVTPAGEAVQQAIATLTPLVAALPLPAGGLPDRTAPRRMDGLARTPVGRALVATRSGRRIETLRALRSRLGQPEAILCLGNGPSSEDPSVLTLRYDALFRVNWRWLDRGILTRPDMVFVGDLNTPARVRPGCVFGFRTVAWESEVLLRHLILHGRLQRLEHFTYGRASSFLDDGAWPVHPTNGAVMIATAAALEPRRLIIAGIDLYLDRRGRHPWDAVAENDFPQMHSRQVEVEIIDRVLASYAGETLILSEPLRQALAAHRAGRSVNPT